MINTDSFSKRLQNILNYYDLSATAFAQKIGVQRSSISHLLSGRNNPSLDFVLKVLEHFKEVNFEWLVKGEGSFPSSENVPRKEVANPTLFDTIDEKTVSVKKKSSTAVKKEHLVQSTGENATKKIAKVLLLYSDGSFKVYD